jgi:hypothetical protein
MVSNANYYSGSCVVPILGHFNLTFFYFRPSHLTQGSSADGNECYQGHGVRQTSTSCQYFPSELLHYSELNEPCGGPIYR